MKKNNSMRVAIIVIALTLITSCFVGTTFAKYAASIETGDTARVAKFAVAAFGETLNEVEDSATFNLFNVSAVYDTKNADYANGVDDDDIKNAENDEAPIIAPGSWGTFNYTVANNSEVAVTYAIAYTYDDDGANIPIEWTLTPGDEASWSTIGTLDVAATELEVGAAAVPVTVYWRWAISEQPDAADTALGFVGEAAPEVTILVTFEQVD